MRYGFVIDQNRCIGCHACTVACKEEHDVALGVFRTWVKYIEKGEFPATRRYFGVLRCNHCDDAPCVEICPTRALFRRRDGIIDFDGARCIGCKSCMQACPYDALYMDPRTQTAAKCNFCAHRVEVGLEPACVIVCPEQAIIAGDLDDSGSRISRMVATQKVSVRKPEKGTRPKLFYADIEEDLLHPEMMVPQDGYLWADKDPREAACARGHEEAEKAAPGAAREIYDVAHPQPWGRNIASYLWAKSIAAGILLVAALLLYLGFEEERFLLNLVSPVVALIFIGITTLLLVVDLKRPERFYYLLIRPNLRSWLVWGGYILMAYGFLSALWLFLGSTTDSIPRLLFWSTGILAVFSACYSAFLFAQAKGRDFWQSPLFLWHLLVQAIAAGAAVLIICGVILGAGSSFMELLSALLGACLALSFAMILGELFLPHRNEHVKMATELLKVGSLSMNFWSFAVGLGLLLPLVLLFFSGGSSSVYFLASVFALAGLWFFEDLWLKAGQAVPLS